MVDTLAPNFTTASNDKGTLNMPGRSLRLIRCVADRPSTATKGRNPLLECIIENDWQKARENLLTHPDLAKKWSISQSFSGNMLHESEILPLHQACAKADVEIDFLESLIVAFPASIGHRETANDRNPLHIATKFHLPDKIISYLLLRDPDAALYQDVFGRVPLHYACSNLASKTTIEKLITAQPITTRATDHKGWTPLHVAASHSSSLAIVETVLKSSPEVIGMITVKGSTPICCAKMNNSNDHDLILARLLNEEQNFYQMPLFENMRKAEKQYRQSSNMVGSAAINANFLLHNSREGQLV